MTFIRDDQIQAAWISLLKANTSITAEVDAAQIKESQIQSTNFSYPGIRVRVGPNSKNEKACPQNVTVRLMVYSEEASSQQVMRIAGIIDEQYHEESFSTSGLSQDMVFTGIKADLFPAVRSNRNTWRQEVVLNLTVN